MDEQVFQQYLKNSQQILSESEGNEKGSQDLLNLVESYIEKSRDEGGDYEKFFKGEKAFYHKQYKLALKYYSMARSVPNFRFFCHRTTAEVFKKSGKLTEALNFAKKALNECPADIVTLKALEELLRESSQHQEAKNIREKIAHIVSEDESEEKSFSKGESEKESTSSNLENYKPVSLAKEELDELTGMFDQDGELVDSEPAGEVLFSSDTEPEKLSSSLKESTEFEKDDEKSFSEEFEGKTLDDMMKEPFLFREGNESFENSEFLEDKDFYGNHSEALEELKKLVDDGISLEKKSSHSLLGSSLGLEAGAEISLEKRVEQFHKHQSTLISHYVEQSQMRKELDRDFLYVLNGWNYQREKDLSVYGGQAKISSFLLPEYRRKTCGGIYLRWNGKGIVINPGMNFLENFHYHGLYVKDIDCVIVTRDNTDAYSDVKGIYDLNYQHNTVSSSLHVINYYLNQKAYNNIATLLKPRFKQERNTIHCLELYLDSPDVEVLNLYEGVSLRYFYISPSNQDNQPSEREETGDLDQEHSCLGIRLELDSSARLEKESKKESFSLGFASGVSWSPRLASSLKGCNIIIAGFEKTGVDDYSKLKYNGDCLGYYGTYSLVKEAQPRLLLCCEFSGREGDIRVEVVKKLREELRKESKQETVILPGDTGLYLDLERLSIQCSISKAFVDPQKIRVVKSSEAFGDLKYLCPSCFI